MSSFRRFAAKNSLDDTLYSEFAKKKADSERTWGDMYRSETQFGPDTPEYFSDPAFILSLIKDREDTFEYYGLTEKGWTFEASDGPQIGNRNNFILTNNQTGQSIQIDYSLNIEITNVDEPYDDSVPERPY